LALTPNTTATDNIATLDKLPNDVDGLTAEQFQLLFDKFGIDFKTYFNDVHLVEIADQLATKAELIGITLGAVPLGSIGIPQLSFDPATQAELEASAALLIPLTQKGATNGVADLDSSGLVPLAQTPTRFANGAFTETTFSGDVGATFIKTIPLGFVGKKGTVHLSGTPTTSIVTSINVTTYTGTTEVWVNGEPRNTAITTSFCWYLKRAYLSGTNLIIEVWRQSNAGSVYTIDLNVRWEAFA